MYSRSHFAMLLLLQSSVASSSVIAMPLLHDRQPTCVSIVIPGLAKSDIVAHHGSIDSSSSVSSPRLGQALRF
uniref:Secreted protein n=1 Tax=Zea mays TaxID=4577 RepID=C0P8W4_MAIZE|nr:unknown [Zea mays]ACR35096.1 unknown [Zea mays]